MYDIIVVGGGAAGMTAALYALRNGKSALVIEKNGFGGQITHSPKVENYPGTLQMSGNEFAEKMLDQILAQGAEIEFENVISIEDQGAVKVIRTQEGGVYEAGAVVLATGVKHRMLGLEGEEDLVGEGISFCAVCDGDFYTGRRVCMAGGGNSALQEAILLSEKCSEVIMLQDLDFFTGEQRLQDVLFAKPNVKSFTGVRIDRLLQKDGELCGLAVEDKKTGEVREILDFLQEAGYLTQDEQGHYRQADRSLRMSHPSRSTKTVQKAVAHDLQVQMAELAVDTLKNDPAQDRNITGLTLGITREAYAKIVEELAECRRRIVAIATESAKTEEVYRLNMQLFPLTNMATPLKQPL